MASTGHNFQQTPLLLAKSMNNKINTSCEKKKEEDHHTDLPDELLTKSEQIIVYEQIRQVDRTD